MIKDNNQNYIQAEQDYLNGMKYKDIASKYGVTINTVKSWKQRYGWNKKGVHTKSKKVCTKKASKTPDADDGTKATLQNNNLTPEQQMFCIYYIKSFNATQSYMKAFNCSYDVGRILRTFKIKKNVEVTDNGKIII